MTFLPIVARELRLASRRRGTYALRAGLALGAILIGVILFLASALASPVQLGKTIFWSLAGLAMIYCLGAGRVATADCLSEEKRDGTLGLLFLTDLTGFDVVLGKLVATSVNGFYALLAIMPVLAVPLLVGGMTNGEFWRMVLVLVATFLFSLALGLFSSSLCRDRRSALAINLVLLLTFTLGLPAAWGALNYFSPARAWNFSFPSPGYAFVLCEAGLYVLNGEDYWFAVGIILGLAGLFVLLACQITPRSWQDKPARAATGKNTWLEFWEACSFGPAAKRPAHRKRLLDINAFYWHAARARLKPLQVWIFIACMALWWLWVGGATGSLFTEFAISITTALLLNSTLKIWIAIEAGQRLAEDRKTGALELVLCTNLTVRDILHGQWLALRRQFLRPLLFIATVELLFMVALWWHQRDAQTLAVGLTGICLLFADAAALGWVAMSAVLTTRNHNQATIRTLLLLLVLPVAATGLAMLAASLWGMLFSSPVWSPNWLFLLVCWAGFGLAADLLFGLHARRNLLHNLRPNPDSSPALILNPNPTPNLNLSPPPPQRAKSSIFNLKLLIFNFRTRSRIFNFKFLFFNCLVLVAVLLVWRQTHRKVPSSVLIASHGNPAALRVYSGQFGALFILPDGSLWRWGQPEGPPYPRAAVPERVGTNTDWATLSLMYEHCLGLRSNGTLYEWHFRGNVFTNLDPGLAPELVNPDHDWAGVSAGYNFALARKRDGTLWSWGNNQQNQLGNGPGKNNGNPAQIGTNHDWLDAGISAFGPLALRADGTLWTWGRVFSMSTRTQTNYAMPTRVNSDTNWVAFAQNSGLQWPRNRAGEIWNPLYMPADPDQPVTATGLLLATNVANAPFATGVRPDAPNVLVRYEVRSDGTLWTIPFSGGLGPVLLPQFWRPFGERADWVSFWGAGGAMFGLTKDGTLWTWGADFSRDPSVDYEMRLAQLKLRLASLFGTTRATGSGLNPGPPLQKEPRPLLRLVPAKPNR